MKNIFKYLLVFSCLMVFTYVTGQQFTANTALLWSVSAVISAVVTFVLRNALQKNEFNRIFLISIFLLMITVPLTGPKETTSLEKRQLAEFPKFKASNVWQFFKQYQKYFSDRFAFRNKSLEIISTIKMRVFDISSVPDRVEIGVDQWLFSAGSYYVELTSKPFTDPELKLIETNLEIITRYMEKRNIKFYFFCVPVKCRIYPEMMPPALARLNAFSRLDQVYHYIRNNKNIRIIDARQELIAAKKIRETYMKTDTHWNEYGAFLGYKKTMETMQKDFPELKMHDFSEYQLDSAILEEGDLLMNLGRSDGIAFRNYTMKLKSGAKPQVADSTVAGAFAKFASVREMPGSINKLKIFVNRDSMTEFLKKYLSTSFDRAYYFWKPYLVVPLVVNEKPDILLHEMSEIFIANTLKLPAEIKGDTLFMRKNFPDYSKIESQVDVAKFVMF